MAFQRSSCYLAVLAVVWGCGKSHAPVSAGIHGQPDAGSGSADTDVVHTAHPMQQNSGGGAGSGAGTSDAATSDAATSDAGMTDGGNASVHPDNDAGTASNAQHASGTCSAPLPSGFCFVSDPGDFIGGGTSVISP